MSLQVKEIENIKVILGPHMTEKAYSDNNMQQYVFKVTKDANKTEIKQAVESLFEVKVKTVKTLNVKGKVKSFKQRLGKRKSWKKAYVQLQDGFDLDFVGAVDKG